MRKKPTILIGAVIIVYVAARLWRLTDSCLWFDEIFSIHAAEHSWAGLMAFAAKDLIHPPLFYFVLKLWMSALGDSVLWLRILPVVLSVMALYPLWMLCRELKLKQTTTIVALGLFAVNGALIKYAQEVRMYSLLLLLALLSIWLFSRYYFRGKSFWILVIANILLVHTHYFGWFVVLTEVMLIAAMQRIKILQTLLMLGVTAVSFVPWLFAIYHYAEPGSSVNQNIGWMRRPGIPAMLEFAFDVVDPFYFQQSSIDASANFVIAFPIAAVLIAAAVVFLINFGNLEIKDRIIFLAFFAAIPLAVVFILSWILPVSIWGSRHLLIVFPPVILLFSIFLTEISPAALRYSLIGPVFVLAVAGFIMQARTEPPRHIWCTFDEFAGQWSAETAEDPTPGALYVFEDLIAYHYWFAARQTPNAKVVLVKDIEGMPNDPAYFLPRGFDGVAVNSLIGVAGDEIWLSFRERTKTQSSAEGARRFEVPVTNFENLGYTVDEVKSTAVGSQTAYLVRMKKAPPTARP